MAGLDPAMRLPQLMATGVKHGEDESVLGQDAASAAAPFIGPHRCLVAFKVMAGDELLADQRCAADMIKIDVEGYEHEVLSGLSATLGHFRPDLKVELHGRGIAMVGSTFDAMLALLKDAATGFI